MYGETAEGCAGDGEDVETEHDAVGCCDFLEEIYIVWDGADVNGEKGVGGANQIKTCPISSCMHARH